jgi:hypothetical protein
MKGQTTKPTFAKSSAGKYFKYAIGEIILVVIGILIALQINTWNNRRLDKDREAFLIRQIHIEMSDNLKQLNNVQSNIKVIVDAGSNIIDLFPLDLEKVQHEEFGNNFSKFLYCPSFDPYQGTVKSIINTGDLNLIQNDSLRKLIVTWEDVLADYKEEEQMAWQYGYKIKEWTTDHFPHPKVVSWDNFPLNFKGLQARIEEKVFRYGYCHDGEDSRILRTHLKALIDLTAND